VSDMQSQAGPQGTLAYRAAKYAVIVLTALIILALIGLVVGSVMNLSGRSTKLLGTVSSQTLVLPPGARILSSESQPGRLILHVRSPAGDEVDIVNTDDGKLIGRVVAAPPPPPSRQ
jgi:hypothetical protein